MSKIKDFIKNSRILNPLAHELYYTYQRVRDRHKAESPAGVRPVQAAHPVPSKPLSERKQLWAFNAGDTFSGNPKWLFFYVCKYRKDIDAYWLCDNETTLRRIRSLGFKAYRFHSRTGIKKQRNTGVFCVEQVKEQIPKNMPADVILLNLYHGVGCKTVEKYVDFGFLAKRIAQKYIRHNEYYDTNMLFLVSSPLMEDHFIKQIGLKKSNLIRAGYPRCMYQTLFAPVSTFDHDIRQKKGLPETTRIAAYVPTYRDSADFDFWAHAVPDFDALLNVLKKENILLIFKLHPQMLKDPAYKTIAHRYASEPHLLFWDNTLDFYEIFADIDIGIVDYSSIYYDMLAAGVKHFIRYFFDYDARGTHLRDFVFDPAEMTSGTMCKTFPELLAALTHPAESDTADTQRMHDLFWSYASPDTFEIIVNQTLSFTPEAKSTLPTLYSYDIFDTLISRKVLVPEGIFYAVKQNIVESGISFPSYVRENYPLVRMFCESNAREYYRKSLAFRADHRREITFDMIFDRMQTLYGLSDEQITLLKEWELQAEQDNVLPRTDMIKTLTDMLDRGDRVLLISDMYLEKSFIKELLIKADPRLADVPLLLSSDRGVQKTTGLLYLQAYLSVKPYHYRQWIHYGDNAFSDGKCALNMGITPVLHSVPAPNAYEQALTNALDSYDGFLTAAALCRFRETAADQKDVFSYGFVSLCFVPYIDWVTTHAFREGYETLYFISRDGYHLKRIADVIISEKKLPLKTKYIYGSRSAWRIPSFTDRVDEEFFSEAGAFSQINTYDALLFAMQVNEEEFARFFPQYAHLKHASIIPKKNRDAVASAAKASREYNDFLLKKGAEIRPLVLRYLKQEIDFSERFAFVEYWGRGYTQTCLTRLLSLAADDPSLTDPVYYARSIYPSDGPDVRYNFTGKDNPLLFVEALFANMPYNTIEAYEIKGDRAEPVMTKRDCDSALFESMERLLPAFARDYCHLELRDRDRTDRELFDFALTYYYDHQDDPLFAECIGSLVDSVGTYGRKRPFAPPVTRDMLDRIYRGENPALLTSSYEMTMARSKPRLAEKFRYLVITRKKQ